MKAECPYCGADVDIESDRELEDGALYSDTCGNCEKEFAFSAYVVYLVNTYKADCLNNGNHKFKATSTYPRVFTEMKCADCGETRKPTIEEWRVILTKEEIEEAKHEYPLVNWINEL